MASPMVEGRSLNPREKAHFSLHISDRIADGDSTLGSFSSIKYNHKPRQDASSRTATLKATSADRYALTLQDRDGDQRGSRSTFSGQKQAPKRSYVLLFDSTTQRATLEPLSSVYTFNLSTENGKDKSSAYPRIYPKKQKDEPSQPTEDDLFDDEGKGDREDDEPDLDNPFDFRHFLSKDKDKQGNESPFAVPSSPDYRTGTGSAANTPLMAPKKPAATTTTAARPKPTPAARKRKSPGVDPMVTRKPTVKKAQPTPTVRLDRRASTHPKPEPAAATSTGRKPAGRKAAQPPSSKIKSSEIVHSSDDSDIEGEPVSSPPPPAPVSPEPVREPSDHEDDEDEDEDENMDGGGGGLEIEVPDARPTKPRHNALASLGLGQSLGLGGLAHLKSPSNGPISLASAANSAEGSPNPTFTPRKASRRKTLEEDVIDFGDMSGRGDDSDEEMGDVGGAYDDDVDGKAEEEFEDRDVEPMDIGPPAQQQGGSSASANRKTSIGGPAEDEEENDPLYQDLLAGLAGGESSEESEEE